MVEARQNVLLQAVINNREKQQKLKGRRESFGTRKEQTFALFNAGVTGASEIGQALGVSRIQVWKYLDALAQDGKLQKKDTGYILKTKETEAAKVFLDLDTDTWINSYSCVRSWVDDLLVRKNGKPLKAWRRNVTFVKGLCELLKIAPDALITKSIQDERDPSKVLSGHKVTDMWLTKFALKFQELKPNSSPKAYVMAVRNFAQFHGIHWQRGISGIASGKKESYGNYAHVKLSVEQIEKGGEIALTELPVSDDDFFCRQDIHDIWNWGIETCARRESILLTRINRIEVHDTYISAIMYESKTETDWEKFIMRPQVQAEIKIRIEQRKAQGKRFLFIDNEGFSTKYYQELCNKLRFIYGRLGVLEQEPYFDNKPVHALRHIGAHYWLGLTNYNYALVAEIGGWKTIDILKDCYGKMPVEFKVRAIQEAGAKLTQGLQMKVVEQSPAPQISFSTAGPGA
jgi:biotin operon repressor